MRARTADLLAGAIGAAGGVAIHYLIRDFPAPGPSGLDGIPVLAWALSLLALAAFGCFSALLSMRDLRAQTLPNGLVLQATLWTILLLSASSVAGGDLRGLLLSWIGAAVFGLLAFLGWLRWRTRFGAGDVKLMPVAAFAAVWGSSGHEYFTGFIVFLLIMFGGVLVAGLAAILLKRERFAAGPVILGSSWLTMVFMLAR